MTSCKKITFIFLFLTFALLQIGIANAIVWKRWETGFTSSVDYDNPYKDVTLKVTFTGPQGQSFSGYGFWDGGKTFKIRCAFPVPGSWRLETICSDISNKGLHNRSGSVMVAPYSGSNPLYQHGFLKAEPGKKYLLHHDNTPFLWMGNTAWIAPLNASHAEWKTYIDDIAGKHFSVIQIALASKWGGDHDYRNNVPFLSEEKWNPPFWQEYEKKVQYANEKGIVVMIMGVMEPVYRYPAVSVVKLLARNLAARLSGNHVIFSPSFDSEINALADSAGNELRKATSRHLITQHPGTPWHTATNTIAETYYDRSYLDFTMNQSGHNRGDLYYVTKNAIEWNLSLYNRGTKPVINGEAFYHGNPAAANELSRGTAEIARQCGYLSWLSGASGYTYGALGLWNWGIEQDSIFVPWKDAMALNSSVHMKHMSDFFSSIEWWKLVPQHEKIINQSDKYVTKMVYAQTADGLSGVAYLPDNASIRLDMSGFISKAVTAKWYNPVTGTYTIITDRLSNSGEHEFKRPSAGDWVLLLSCNGAESGPGN